MLRRYHIITATCVVSAVALGVVVTVRAQQPTSNAPPPGNYVPSWGGLFGPPPQPNGKGQGQGQGQGQNPAQGQQGQGLSHGNGQRQGPPQGQPHGYGQGQGQNPNYTQGQYRRPYQNPPPRNAQGNPPNGGGPRQPNGTSKGFADYMRGFVGEPTRNGNPKQRQTNPGTTANRQPAHPQSPQGQQQTSRPRSEPVRTGAVPPKSRRATGERMTAGDDSERRAAAAPSQDEEDEAQDEARREIQTVPRRGESTSRRVQTEEQEILSDSAATSSRRTQSGRGGHKSPRADEDPSDENEDDDGAAEPRGTSSRARQSDEEPEETQPSSRRDQNSQSSSPREARATVTPDPVSPRVGAPPETRTQPRREPSPYGENVLLRRQGPALIVETLGPRKIIVDKEASYRVILRNVGEGASPDARVTVQVPNWAEVVGATPSRGKVQLPSAEKPDEGIRWQVQSVRGGGHEELVIKLIPRDSRTLDLAVSLQSAAIDSQFSVEVREAKLQLNIAGPREVNFGEKAVYELTFSNTGSADAENVLVKLMPIDPGDEADTHEIGTIPAGAKQTVEIELVARQPGTLAIVAEASADSGIKTDARKDVIVLKPEIRVEMRGPKFRYAHTVATYTIRITNPGNAIARGVQLGAMMPVQATFISATGGGGPKEGEPNQILWKVPDIQPNGEQVFELKCELGKPGSNRVQVAVMGDGDLRDANFVATEVEAMADLHLEVNDPKGPMPLGEEVPFEIIVKNRGAKGADNVQAFAFFSEGVEPVQVIGHRHQIEPGKVILDPILKLGPGESVTVKILAKAQKAGSHTFRAEVHCPSLIVKLSQQETTQFYGDDRQGAFSSEKDSTSEDDSPKSGDDHAGPPAVTPPTEPGKVTPSHPKPVDPKLPPGIPLPEGVPPPVKK
jgi:uncharacterized repeat protein (TIGR01451 family)